MIGESVQQLVLPGSCVDTYYAGVSNVEKQCFPSRVQNKFYITLNSKSPGSESALLFNPNQGVTDMVLELQLPADLSGVAGLAINRGWGYRMIESLSFRYASAPQFFVQGPQHFISVMEACENGTKRDQLVQIGGQALLTPADFADPLKRTAYVYIKLPHNSPRAAKPLPYPSDLTTQPFQLTIQLADWTRVFLNGAAIPSGLQFKTAQLNYRQVELNNSADLLAQREDMSKMMYILPLDRFEQRQVAIPLQNNGLSQTVQLTGFRSGEIKNIVLWAVDNADIAATPTGNWFNYLPLQNVVLTVNGDVRFDSRDGSAQMWDLVTNTSAASWSNTVITAGSPNTASPTNGFWTSIPMGQKAVDDIGNSFELTHGYSVMNSVLNLQVQLPANALGYTLYAAYWYSACLSFHSGQVDYVF